MNFLSLLPILVFTTSALAAETTVSVRGRKISLLGDGTKPTLVDITPDLKKQKIGLAPETSRLVKMELKVKAAPTGAIFALMLDGAAVDSSTISDDQVKTITLSADTGSTPQPWIIGVRGSAEILDMKVTVDAAGTEPAPRPVAPSLPPTSEPSVPPPTDVGDTEILQPGQKIMIVSRTSGNIDVGSIRRFDSVKGKYVVVYQGKEYFGFDRDQLGLLSGCENGFCVGDKVIRDEERLTIRARLSTGSWVVEDADGEKTVATTAELTKRQSAPTKQAETPRPPADIGGGRTFYPGQLVLYVLPNGRTQTLTLMEANRGMVTLVTFNGLSQTVPDDSRVAVFGGCEKTFCVGDQILTTDRSGMRHQGVIIAMQSPSLVVIRLMDYPVDLGNWPLASLRHIN